MELGGGYLNPIGGGPTGRIRIFGETVEADGGTLAVVDNKISSKGSQVFVGLRFVSDFDFPSNNIAGIGIGDFQARRNGG